MSVSVSDVMRHVRRCFCAAYVDGAWQLHGGMLSPEDAFAPGDWIAVESGPVRGVYQLDEYGALPVKREASWEGRIHRLEPPADFLRLCDDIRRWSERHPDVTMRSERFGEYSRSQTSPAWQAVFAAQLRPYRRMYPEVDV